LRRQSRCFDRLRQCKFDSTMQASCLNFSPRDISNPYLPLASLKQDILKNKNERVERTICPNPQDV